MYYNYRYSLDPSDSQRETLDYHRDVCRQLYNHALYRFNRIPEDEGTLNQRVRKIRDELPDLKTWWDALTDVYAKVLQPTVMRIEHNVKALGELKNRGYNVGELKWKSPQEFRSFTYNQSGFELDKKSGQPVLSLSKLADIPIRLHRPIPENATIKEITLKKEPTGGWFAIFGIEFDCEPPEPPDEVTDAVGIDVGILNYTHDTDGTAVKSLDLTDERERLEREQRKLSRKDHGSNNWEKQRHQKSKISGWRTRRFASRQRQRVAECHATIKRKRRDFLHKLSMYYATEYDLVAVEDLNAKGLIERPSNGRNRASAAWGTFRRMLQYKCERNGTHFVAVEPAGTTEACAACGVSTDKPLWIREHSCPSCGFEADRDANAAYNILSRGIKHVGVGHSESRPVETALPVETTSVSAKRVIETGSPTLKERTATAVSE